MNQPPGATGFDFFIVAFQPHWAGMGFRQSSIQAARIVTRVAVAPRAILERFPSQYRYHSS